MASFAAAAEQGEAQFFGFVQRNPFLRNSISWIGLSISIHILEDAYRAQGFTVGGNQGILLCFCNLVPRRKADVARLLRYGDGLSEYA
jgi:hypothetical protein